MMSVGIAVLAVLVPLVLLGIAVVGWASFRAGTFSL